MIAEPHSTVGDHEVSIATLGKQVETTNVMGFYQPGLEVI